MVPSLSPARRHANRCGVVVADHCDRIIPGANGVPGEQSFELPHMGRARGESSRAVETILSVSPDRLASLIA